MQAVDAAFLQLTVGKTLQRSASAHLLFAFEYVIQVRADHWTQCMPHAPF